MGFFPFAIYDNNIFNFVATIKSLCYLAGGSSIISFINENVTVRHLFRNEQTTNESLSLKLSIYKIYK